MMYIIQHLITVKQDVVVGETGASLHFTNTVSFIVENNRALNPDLNYSRL